VGSLEGRVGEPGIGVFCGALFVVVVLLLEFWFDLILVFIGTGFDVVLLVVVPCASLGILFGGCTLLMGFVLFTGLPVVRLFACPDVGLFFALVVDRVTLAGRCSEAAALVVGAAERGAIFLTFCGRAGVVVFAVFAAATAAVVWARTIGGKASSVSSSSQSFVLFRLATGVLRGCPGGEMSFAFSWAAATCLLGVTGGNCFVRMAVVVEASFISSSSAGGVAGATTFVAAAAAVRAAICCA
jgi:hypothetical protein